MGERDSASIIIQWLVSDGPRCQTPADLLENYCARLREHGVPVDRATLGAPLLHPIAQSSYVFWHVESGATLRWFQWTPDALEMMRASPIYPIYTQGKGASLRLAGEEDRARFPIGRDLWDEGYVQYEALSLQFSDGTHKALTLATKDREGFSPTALALVGRTLAALALVFESFISRNTARTLMETYVGKRAGLRVLEGEIERGDGAYIDAVIFFADLRGFTRLSQESDGDRLLAILNDHFGRLTEAVETNGGEVLKFIGDAMLAIFAHEGDLVDAVERAETAAFAAIAGRKDEPGGDYAFGIGLHPGTVFYGNIGGGTRLDFTVIGAAVNVASRIEALTASLGEPLLASKDLAQHSRRQWQSLGTFELKGVGRPVEVLKPAQ
jgi:adenylate cyclase